MESWLYQLSEDKEVEGRESATASNELSTMPSSSFSFSTFSPISPLPTFSPFSAFSLSSSVSLTNCTLRTQNLNNNSSNNNSRAAVNKNNNENSFYSVNSDEQLKKSRKLLNSNNSIFLKEKSEKENKSLFSVFNYHNYNTVKYDEKQFLIEIKNNESEGNILHFFKFSTSTVLKEIFYEENREFEKKKDQETLNLKIISKVSIIMSNFSVYFLFFSYFLIHYYLHFRQFFIISQI